MPEKSSDKPEYKTERPEDKILKKFEWEEKEAVVKYPQENNLEDIMEVVLDVRRKREEEAKKKTTPITEEYKKMWEESIEAAQKGEILVLVIEFNGKVRGFIDIRKGCKKMNSDDLNESTLNTSQDTATIHNIAVHTGYRGKGTHFARALLDAGISEARNVLKVKKIELQTDEDNNPAIHLYENCGFESKGFDPELRHRDDKTVRRLNMELNL